MNVYDKAAALLKRDGWYQGSSVGPNGERCMGQAIYAAVTDDNSYAPALAQQAVDAMNWVTRTVLGGQAVPIWNDQPERTSDEVFTVLALASKLWDAEQIVKREAELDLAKFALAKAELVSQDAVRNLIKAMTGVTIVATAPTVPDPEPTEPEPVDVPELVGV